MTEGIHKAVIIHRALVLECKVCILHHAVNYVHSFSDKLLQCIDIHHSHCLSPHHKVWGSVRLASSVVDCICKVKSNRPRIPLDEVGTRISVMHRAI